MKLNLASLACFSFLGAVSHLRTFYFIFLYFLRLLSYTTKCVFLPAPEIRYDLAYQQMKTVEYTVTHPRWKPATTEN